MDRQTALRDGAGIGVDVDRAGVHCGSGPVCGANYREPTVVTLLAGADHARPEAPLGATLSRRWRKREALIQERDRLMRAACGDWEERVREIDETLDTQWKV